MTSDDWIIIYSDLADLRTEFLQNWRKTNFKYNTEYVANCKRIEEIIDKSVQIITHNKDLRKFLFDGETDDYRNYMEATGFWVDTVYYSYIQKVLSYIEKQMV